MVLCADCGVDNLPQARFCRECGRSLAKEHLCSICGTENPAGSHFCNQCGAQLSRPAQAGAYESELPVARPHSAASPAEEPPLAPEEDWQEAVRLMSGLADGIQVPEGELSAAPKPTARTPAEWVALLGECHSSAICLAGSLGPEGPGLPLQTWPLALPALDSEAGGALLGKQYGTSPLALRVPKNRRVWFA